MSEGVFGDCGWLNELSASEHRKILAASELEEFESAQLIFQPFPDTGKIHVLLKGLVRMFRMAPSGAEFTLGFVHTGEVFGELGLFTGQPGQSHAVAMEKSEVLKIDSDVFLALMKSEVAALFAVTSQIARRFKEIENRSEDLVFQNAEARLARAIVDMVYCNRRILSDDSVSYATVTVNDLAKLSGLSRPTASIALGGLLRKELVLRIDGNLEIGSMSALEALYNES